MNVFLLIKSIHSKLFTYYNSSLFNKFHQPDFQLDNLQPLQAVGTIFRCGRVLSQRHVWALSNYVRWRNRWSWHWATGHWGNSTWSQLARQKATSNGPSWRASTLQVLLTHSPVRSDVCQSPRRHPVRLRCQRWWLPEIDLFGFIYN